MQDLANRLGKMQQVVVRGDKTMEEMRSKISWNRQILTSNWEQVESEVRRLVDRSLLMTIDSVLDLSQHYPGLAQLVAIL